MKPEFLKIIRCYLLPLFVVGVGLSPVQSLNADPASTEVAQVTSLSHVVVNEVIFEEVHGNSTAKLALHNDWINHKGYQEDAVVNMNPPFSNRDYMKEYIYNRFKK
jgi:hypothetical protein